MEIDFDWNLKDKPEDFIVKEVAEHPLSEDGRYFLYLLIKRNMNTKEITVPYRLWYAGLKDKNALTFQYVSSDKYLGEFFKEKRDSGTYFIMYFIGRVVRRVKIGYLKGNRFSIRLKRDVDIKDWFINYYDLQRIERNLSKGKRLLLTLDEGITWRRLKWLQNFYIESYLSYLWNRSLQLYMMESFEGYFIKEKRYKFFIPKTNYSYLFKNIQKFWSILGYKVKLNEGNFEIYNQLNNFRLFSSKYENSFIVIQTSKIYNKPSLIFSYYGNNKSISSLFKFDFKRLITISGNVGIISNSELTTFDIGKKLSIRFENNINFWYYWNKYKTVLFVLLGFILFVFMAYIFNNLTGKKYEPKD